MSDYTYEYLGSAKTKELAWAMLEHATGVVRKPKYWVEEDDIILLVIGSDGSPSARYLTPIGTEQAVLGRIRRLDAHSWVAEKATPKKKWSEWQSEFKYARLPDRELRWNEDEYRMEARFYG